MSKRFQSASLLWWIIIPASIILAFMLGHYPNIILYSNFGGLGALLSSIVLNYRILIIIGFWATVIAHGYEAILARRICKKLNIDQESTLLWTIQTFILGFPSLTILRGYVRQHK